MAQEFVIVDALLAEPTMGPVTMTHTIGTAGTVAGTLLAANANRKYARFQNTSDTAVSLKFGAAAVAGQGVVLAATGTIGDVFEISYQAGNLTTVYVSYISSAASKTVVVTEGV